MTVFSLGGTIASTAGDGPGVSPRLTAADLVAAVPGLDEIADLAAVAFRSGETLRSTYGFPGSETDLLARGLIAAGYLDAPKARVLLSLVLASGRDPADAFAEVAPRA